MGTLLRIAAAALILVGLSTGCSRTTPGTVAMTTEPGPPLASPSRTPSTEVPNFPRIPGLPNLPAIPIPGFPTPGGTEVPDVPAPANASTMKCGEYNDLDEATQRAVIRAILADGNRPQTTEDEMVSLILAGSICQFLPSAVVKEVVLGGSPP